MSQKGFLAMKISKAKKILVFLSLFTCSFLSSFDTPSKATTSDRKNYLYNAFTAFKNWVLGEKEPRGKITKPDPFSFLRYAVKSGNIGALRTLLQKDVNINEQDKKKKTILHYAIDDEKNNNIELIRTLLSVPGIDVNVQDDKGRTPLHNATDNENDNNLEIVQLLLDKGARVNIKNNKGYTPLDNAANNESNNNLKMVGLLLERSANVNVKDNQGFTPLHGAASNSNNNNLAMVRLLLLKDADPTATDENGWTPLHSAMANPNKNSLEIAKLLLQNRTYVNRTYVNSQDKDGYTPLHLAISLNDDHSLANVQFFIEQGAYVNTSLKDSGETPLHGAVRNGNLDIVRLLVQKGAEVNAEADNGRTPIQYTDNDDIITFLLENGATPPTEEDIDTKISTADEQKDFYAILGISKNANTSEITKAYRFLARKWHPDRNPDNREMAEEKFKEIARAYEILGNPDVRAHYDTIRAGIVRRPLSGERLLEFK